MHRTKRSLHIQALVALFSFLLTAPSSAVVLTSGDFQPGSLPSTLSITKDLTFDITANGSAGYLVFDEWVSSDGFGQGVDILNAASITYSLNGVVADPPAQAYQLIDNNATNTFDLTPNDGFLEFATFNVTAGDTLTIFAAEFIFGSTFGFNPSIPSIFNGNVYIADLGGNQLSNLSPIPEPASAFILGFLVFALVLGRRSSRL